MHDTNKINISKSPRRDDRFVCQVIAYIWKRRSRLRTVEGCLNRTSTTHHLGDAKAMPKIVKWHQIVVFEHLVQPFAQRIYRYIELFDQAAVDEHGLHQE